MEMLAALSAPFNNCVEASYGIFMNVLRCMCNVHRNYQTNKNNCTQLCMQINGVSLFLTLTILRWHCDAGLTQLKYLVEWILWSATHFQIIFISIFFLEYLHNIWHELWTIDSSKKIFWIISSTNAASMRGWKNKRNILWRIKFDSRVLMSIGWLAMKTRNRRFLYEVQTSVIKVFYGCFMRFSISARAHSS